MLGVTLACHIQRPNAVSQVLSCEALTRASNTMPPNISVLSTQQKINNSDMQLLRKIEQTPTA